MNSPSLHPSLPFIIDGTRAMAIPTKTARLFNSGEQDDSGLRIGPSTSMTAKPPKTCHSYSEEDEFMGMNSYICSCQDSSSYVYKQYCSTYAKDMHRV